MNSYKAVWIFLKSRAQKFKPVVYYLCRRWKTIIKWPIQNSDSFFFQKLCTVSSFTNPNDILYIPLFEF
ncbi:hypothetical protein X975_00752, partial [Stegodyphus mimosarum]